MFLSPPSGPDAEITGVSLVSKNYLVGMAWDTTSDRLYVSEPNLNAVNVYDGPSLTLNKSLSFSGNGLNQPAGLAFDGPRQLLYVANRGNNTVTVY
jgi:DNA-binding beta-propeller fold protein YncE